MKYKDLMKRIEPGRKYRWTGDPLCSQCEGSGVHGGFKRCDVCKGIGSVSWRAKLLAKWLIDTPMALPSEMLPSTVREGDYTWEMWHADTKKKYPVRYFIQESIPRWFRRKVVWPLDRLKWDILHRTTHRYHLVDMRDKENDYPIGWIDPANALLYASFKIFKSFYETGRVPEEVAEEAKALYEWWTVTRPAMLKAYEDVSEKDTEMLQRLMDIRDYLWD